MGPKIFMPVLLVLCMLVVGTLYALDLEGVKCPVSGQPANEEASLSFKEGTIYFCCDGCPDAFAGDTAKFEAKAHHQLVQTGQFIQKGCPKTGRAVNPDTTIDVAGVDVDFCCNGCKSWATQSEGDELIAKIFSADAFEKGFEKNPE